MVSRSSDWPARFGGAALITGASAGIGEAFARALAGRGMDLVLVARRKERLEELATTLAATHGVRTLVVAADLLEASAPERIAAAVTSADQVVGLLVNNAGVGQYGPFEALDPAGAAHMVDLNCRAPIAMTYTFLPGMLERGRGGVIFVASIAGYQPSPFYAAYGATKAFDLMLGEALFAELGPKGIEVLALSPGYTPTEFQQVAGSDTAPGRAAETTPEQVVAVALAALGNKPSVVPGAKNKLMMWATRWLPRKTVGALAHRYSSPRGGGGE